MKPRMHFLSQVCIESGELNVLCFRPVKGGPSLKPIKPLCSGCLEGVKSATSSPWGSTRAVKQEA